MNTKITLVLFLLSSCLWSQNINKIIADAKGKPMLLGKTNKQAFKNKDFSWFEKNYDAYAVNTNVVKKLKNKMNDYTVKVFYGSWCGDSKRELPKFYKVLDKVNFDAKNLEVYAVNKTKEAYKEAPNGEEKGLNVHRVPTFIFYKDGTEIGRIVEYPKQDFERDISKIIEGKKYAPNYAVVHYLNALFKAKNLDKIKKEEVELIPYLAEYTKGSRELNTYGYKLLRSNQIDKALFVFQLNTKMYPYKWNVFDSYGEALYQAKKYKKALQSYSTALALNPKKKEILETLQEINNHIK
ncbi:tetratricopeptide repeat family protein [Tenacibaculum holothuriorum]|uniref:Tetratricopeptide repeat family protein n=1 Tax=Tenacibaculum holothuriorum TaxID=1635173 RepID=A0A1Y2PGU2_9FLAO|nr:thioredoxin domain-containing protein [Tenacibaculum holothuriorum]OSY88929.1 tetratricopeptide repeat family protein [Tenacibaculum holothuriorum]